MNDEYGFNPGLDENEELASVLSSGPSTAMAKKKPSFMDALRAAIRKQYTTGTGQSPPMVSGGPVNPDIQTAQMAGKAGGTIFKALAGLGG